MSAPMAVSIRSPTMLSPSSRAEVAIAFFHHVIFMREQIPVAVSSLKVKGEQIKAELQQGKRKPREKKLLKCVEHISLLELSLRELADANKAILGTITSFYSPIIRCLYILC